MSRLAPGVRDTLVMLAVFGLLIGGLSLYTRSWPPAVIVESGSMMHADDEVHYGRFGTIDPGDLVLVKAVKDVNDITTLVEGGRDRYGKGGDVVIYFRGNDRAGTPIIHRAVAYVVVDGSSYDVRWSDAAPCEGGATKGSHDGHSWCRYGPEGITIPSVPVVGSGSRPNDLRPYRPPSSGFITKGDNPVTNTQIDQLSLPGVNRPIPIEWIGGKSRGELPWLGLIKLAFAGKVNEDSPPDAWVRILWASAPKDLWVMLGVSLAVLVGGPLSFDAVRAWRSKRGA